MNHQEAKLGQAKHGKSLEWPDDPPPKLEDTAALLEMQRQFWAKIAPPIYETRVVVYLDEKLEWD